MSRQQLRTDATLAVAFMNDPDTKIEYLQSLGYTNRVIQRIMSKAHTFRSNIWHIVGNTEFLRLQRRFRRSIR